YSGTRPPPSSCSAACVKRTGPSSGLANRDLAGHDRLLRLLLLRGEAARVISQGLGDLLIECLQTLLPDLWLPGVIEIPDRNHHAVGAEHARELGPLAEVQLASGMNASQRVEQLILILR